MLLIRYKWVKVYWPEISVAYRLKFITKTFLGDAFLMLSICTKYFTLHLYRFLKLIIKKKKSIIFHSALLLLDIVFVLSRTEMMKDLTL